MRRIIWAGPMGVKQRFLGIAACLLLGAVAASAVNRSEAVEAALRAYTEGEYPKAIQILQAASAADPQNSEIYLLLSKSYYEMQDFERASASAEKAVAIDPNNSINHEWLGRASGERADRAGWLAAIVSTKSSRSLSASSRQVAAKFACPYESAIADASRRALMTRSKS